MFNFFFYSILVSSMCYLFWPLLESDSVTVVALVSIFYCGNFPRLVPLGCQFAWKSKSLKVDWKFWMEAWSLDSFTNDWVSRWPVVLVYLNFSNGTCNSFSGNSWFCRGSFNPFKEMIPASEVLELRANSRVGWGVYHHLESRFSLSSCFQCPRHPCPPLCLRSLYLERLWFSFLIQ